MQLASLKANVIDNKSMSTMDSSNVKNNFGAVASSSPLMPPPSSSSSSSSPLSTKFLNTSTDHSHINGHSSLDYLYQAISLIETKQQLNQWQLLNNGQANVLHTQSSPHLLLTQQPALFNNNDNDIIMNKTSLKNGNMAFYDPLHHHHHHHHQQQQQFQRLVTQTTSRLSNESQQALLNQINKNDMNVMHHQFASSNFKTTSSAKSMLGYESNCLTNTNLSNKKISKILHENESHKRSGHGITNQKATATLSRLEKAKQLARKHQQLTHQFNQYNNQQQSLNLYPHASNTDQFNRSMSTSSVSSSTSASSLSPSHTSLSSPLYSRSSSTLNSFQNDFPNTIFQHQNKPILNKLAAQQQSPNTVDLIPYILPNIYNSNQQQPFCALNNNNSLYMQSLITAAILTIANYQHQQQQQQQQHQHQQMAKENQIDNKMPLVNLPFLSSYTSAMSHNLNNMQSNQVVNVKTSKKYKRELDTTEEDKSEAIAKVTEHFKRSLGDRYSEIFFDEDDNQNKKSFFPTKSNKRLKVDNQSKKKLINNSNSQRKSKIDVSDDINNNKTKIDDGKNNLKGDCSCNECKISNKNDDILKESIQLPQNDDIADNDEEFLFQEENLNEESDNVFEEEEDENELVSKGNMNNYDHFSVSSIYSDAAEKLSKKYDSEDTDTALSTYGQDGDEDDEVNANEIDNDANQSYTPDDDLIQEELNEDEEEEDADDIDVDKKSSAENEMADDEDDLSDRLSINTNTIFYEDDEDDADLDGFVSDQKSKRKLSSKDKDEL